MRLLQTANAILAGVCVKHLLLLCPDLQNNLKSITQPARKPWRVHLMRPFLYLCHGFLYALKLNAYTFSQQLFRPALGLCSHSDKPCGPSSWNKGICADYG